MHPRPNPALSPTTPDRAVRAFPPQPVLGTRKPPLMDPPLSGPALTAATAKLKPRGKLCWSLDYIGIHRICTIKLLQTGRDSFTVQYGFQVKPHLTYSSAAHELGACIMHALACESLLDNRTPGER